MIALNILRYPLTLKGERGARYAAVIADGLRDGLVRRSAIPINGSTEVRDRGSRTIPAAMLPAMTTKVRDGQSA